LSVLADELLQQEKVGGAGLSTDLIFSAAKGLMNRARGGYAALVLINGSGILGKYHTMCTPGNSELFQKVGGCMKQFMCVS